MMPSGSKIPPDVRYIVIRLSSIMKPDGIATFTGISKRAVSRILRYFALHGTIESEKERNGKGGHIRDMDLQFLLRTTPLTDIYLDELREILSIKSGQEVSQATVWGMLRRTGFTMKKITRVEAERAAELRRDYMTRIGRYEARQLVFVDESSLDRRTTYRGHAWSIRGTKAQRKKFFVQDKLVSVLPALSLEEGFLHCKVVGGSVTADEFALFIQDLLERMEPFPGPNSVIVLDNSSIHKTPHIQDMIAARGVRCEFLPPYSPDFNPIEIGFSCMRHNLRLHGEHVRLVMTNMSCQEVYCCLMRALYMSGVDVRGWYTYCGYT